MAAVLVGKVNDIRQPAVTDVGLGGVRTREAATAHFSAKGT